MTVERTRLLLGTKVSHLSDDELLLFITRTDKALDSLFSIVVQEAIAKKEKQSI